MNIKLVLHTALKLEADIFIEYFKLKRLNYIKEFSFYLDKKEEILLIISGIGGTNTCLALGYAKGKFSLRDDVVFFNFGFAGHKRLVPGTITNIRSTKEENSDRKIHLTFSLTPREKHFDLLTVSTNKLSKYYEEYLIDNEAYHFISSAQRFVTKEFIFITKLISDNEQEEFNQEKSKMLLNERKEDIQKYILQLLAHQEKNKIKNPLIEYASILENFRLSFSEEIIVKNHLGSLINMQADISDIISKSNNKKELIRNLQIAQKEQNLSY